MIEKLKDFAKNRNTLWSVAVAVAALVGYSSDKVSVDAPVFKVEVTNFPADAGCNCNKPAEQPAGPWPDSYELNLPKVEPGVEVKRSDRVLD